MSVAVRVVHGVDGDAFNVTSLWSDLAGNVVGECAFGLVLVAGPNFVTVTVSYGSIRVFSMMEGLRTTTLIHILVKI